MLVFSNVIFDSSQPEFPLFFQYFCLLLVPGMGTAGRERPKTELKWIFFLWFKDQPVETKEMFS